MTAARAAEPLRVLPFAHDLSRPRGHRHDILTIRLAVCFCVEVRLSLRQAVGVLALLCPLLALGRPAFSTLRQWLLRLGLAALRRAARAVRGGWTLILDTTLGRGTRECLVVLGIPTQELLARPDHDLALADVTALAIEVFHGCDGAKVATSLSELLPRLGRIDQVVCDRGSDLLAGLTRQREALGGAAVTGDVRHLCAALLRGHLMGCPRFGEFAGLCGTAAHRVRQTPGAFLAPPALRDKARYMNLETHLAWAQRVLAWQASPDWGVLARQLNAGEAQARSWFEDRFGWLAGFESDLCAWSGMLQAATLAQGEVRQSGLSRQTAGRFWQGWRQAGAASGCFLAQRYAGQVRDGLAREGAALRAGQVALGSSDVVESLFGKYKEVMGRGPERQVGANVLLMALMCGPAMSAGQIKAGLEEVSTKDLRRWQAERFGRPDRAKRRDLFGKPPHRPPKPDQKPA